MLNTTDDNYYYEAAKSWRGTHTPVTTALHRIVLRIINTVDCSQTAHSPSKHKDKHGFIISQCKHTEL